MKKILSLIMILGLCFTLSGCGSETKNNGSKSSPDNTNVNDNNVNDSDDNIDSESDNPYANKKFIGGRTGKVLVINDMDGTGDVGSITIDGITFEYDASSYSHINGDTKCNIGIDSVKDDNSIRTINVKFCDLSDTYIIEE